MKLLITGATGLVGSILVKKAVEAGHQIHFLSTRINKTADQSSRERILLESPNRRN